MSKPEWAFISALVGVFLVVGLLILLDPFAPEAPPPDYFLQALDNE